jgi:hypothetical protein
MSCLATVEIWIEAAWHDHTDDDMSASRVKQITDGRIAKTSLYRLHGRYDSCSSYGGAHIMRKSFDLEKANKPSHLALILLQFTIRTKDELFQLATFGATTSVSFLCISSAWWYMESKRFTAFCEDQHVV